MFASCGGGCGGSRPGALRRWWHRELAGGLAGIDHFRGPMFADPPLVTRSTTFEIVVSGKSFTSYKYFSIKPGAS
jgi:hypothetical protein